MQIIARVGLRHVGFASCDWRFRIITALLSIKDFALEELHVFAENFDGKAVEIDRLAAGLVNAMSLLLNLFVFQNDVLLNTHHFFSETLDSDELIVGLRLLDREENLKNLMVLILDINQAQLLLLVLSNEANQLSALLNLVQ